MIKALVVDDEPLARESLRMLIARDPEFTVVGECSGVDAPRLAAETKPDVLFLDIHMPELDGFGVIEQLANDPPLIVFTTAYDAYALKAFDVHALDYLLKPFDDERFAETLTRVKQRLRSGTPRTPPDKLLQLLDGRERHPKRILVRVRDKIVVVRTADIDWIEAADYYASIHAGGNTYLLRETLNDLEGRLDPEHFLRVHRSAIVNVDRVREIHP
ncbi:MAG TPA: LytTR family DNA-binding domain-containing protein, partial [Thermoanaerobaculia bacterium]|nr:LytTR family DNA-binding domain-containing protein [Thermoanaerobaculia bacterium]